ncbi:MAG: YtxH domain-containing protein [Prochlorotrichaceae cyanobacterium]|jgi:gas vesicle protein
MPKQKTPETSQPGNNLVTGFLLGAVLGSLSGILLAPRSGRETREQLKAAFGDLSQLTESLSLDLQSQAERLSDQALQRWEDTLNRLKEAIVAGIEASQAEAKSQEQQMAHQNTITVPVHPTAAESPIGGDSSLESSLEPMDESEDSPLDSMP